MSLANVFMNIIARILVIGLAFPLHESAHAFVASKLGDPTARNKGRIDFNPLAHLDLLPTLGMMVIATLADLATGSSSIGNVLLLLTSVLFFHPVPINPFYFKNRKGGVALTALAGPVANVLLGLIFLIFYKVAAYFLPQAYIVTVLCSIFYITILINLQLAAFNLIPIPPLDGSKILAYFLSDRINFMMMKYQRYIVLALFFLLYCTSLLDPVLYWGYRILYYLIDFLTKWIDLLAGMI